MSLLAALGWIVVFLVIGGCILATLCAVIVSGRQSWVERQTDQDGHDRP